MTTKQAQDVKSQPEMIRLKPTGFWSYSRQDDELSFGKLSQLRKLLMAEIQQQFGRERVRIFQDAETISHGAEWEGEIRQSLDDSTFFIPIITPNFIQSEWCTREVALFFEREQRLYEDYPDLPRRGRIFPLLLIDVDDVDPHDEAVWAELRKRQMFDYRQHRFRGLQDEQVQQALAGFAGAIREILQIRVRRPPTPEERARIEEEHRHAAEVAAFERQAEERRRQEADRALRLEAVGTRAAQHLAERERAAGGDGRPPAAMGLPPLAVPPASWPAQAAPKQDGAKRLWLWAALSGLTLVLVTLLVTLLPTQDGRSSETSDPAPVRQKDAAAPAPATSAAPAHAWLYGTWCRSDDPSVVRTISGDVRSITIIYGSRSRTEPILSANPGRVVTNVAEYLQLGSTLRVTEPDAELRYEMRRCTATAR